MSKNERNQKMHPSASASEDAQFEWHPYIEEYGKYSAMRTGNINGFTTVAHDAAVLRAERSIYHSRWQAGDAKKTLFFSCAASYCTEDKIRSYLLDLMSFHCGSCPLVLVKRDPVTEAPLNYGFIRFHKSDDASACLRKHSRCKRGALVESNLIIERVLGRTLRGWKPRRLGGGLGGRKESGQLRFGGHARPFKRPIHQIAERETRPRRKYY